MKTILLHGDNQVASRERLAELVKSAKSRDWEVISLDGKNLKGDEINLQARSQSLLRENVLVVVEVFFSSKKRLDFAKELDENLIFWEPKELSQTQISNLPSGWQVELFKLPKVVFKFLDSLYPGNLGQALKLLSLVKEKEPAERILPLLAWQIRLLIWARIEPQTLVVPEWKRERLIKQAKKFEANTLISFHQALINIDRENKTGVSPLPISSSLDLLVATLAE